MNVDMPLSLLLVALLGIGANPDRPSGSEVQKAARELGLERFPTGLVEIEVIEMLVLPWSVVSARVLDRVPATELVLVKMKRRWKVTTHNKLPLAAANRTGRRLVRESSEIISADPERAAVDLTKTFVDPSPRFGVLIRSIDDIPVSDVLSDRYRDLRRQLGEEKAQASLREGISEVVANLCEGVRLHNATLTFCTWSLLGGAVERWNIDLQGGKFTRNPVATEIGSWKAYH